LRPSSWERHAGAVTGRKLTRAHLKLAAAERGARTSNLAALARRPQTGRYQRGSIIVTSNRGLEAWGEILGDAMVAAALIDRLIHHAHIITLKSKSYRLRERGTAGAPAAAIQPAGLRPTT
jgi:IstB-like ATP binding protein